MVRLQRRTKLMGLRLREGVDLGRLPERYLDNLYNKINSLTGIGLVEVTNQRLSVTAQGRPVLNGVLRQLLED